jgi:hypothetical protein
VRWDETYGGHLAGARAQATIFLLFPRDGASGNHVEKINLVDFSTGVYVCQVNNQNRVYSQKIIKF